MTEVTKPRPDLPMLLIAVSLFLAPLLAGQVAVEGQPMPAGGLLGGILSGDLPVAGQFLPSFFVLLGGIAALLQRRILQIPWLPMSALLVALGFLIVCSVGVSQFPFASQLAALHWATYAVSFFVAAIVTGRRRGPVILAGTLTASCTLVALRALMEYGDTRSPMFAGWSNPNALAGILLLGIFTALGLAASLRERFILPTLASVAMGLALVLTQSKGGLLVFGVAAFVFLVLLAIWLREARGAALKRVAGGLGVVVLLVTALQFAPRASEGGATDAPLGRVAAAGETQAQSFTFRKLLFQSTLDLAKENPIGTGIGTFQYHSAQPGRVTSTVYAHNSTLQLLSETSVVGGALFAGFWVLWLFRMGKGARSLLPEANALRAGITCAVLAVGAHSLIESSFSYVGLGLATFAIAGVGVLLASDSVMPEQVLPPVRALAAVMCGLILLGWVVNLRIEVGRSSVLSAIASQDAAAARAALEAQQSIGAGDPQTWTLSAALAPSIEARLENLEKARKLAPTPKVLREIASLYAEKKDEPKAYAALQQALKWDPNNLLALRQLMEFEDAQGRIDEAMGVARRLIEVEAKTYYTVRSLAEVVPTETFQARLYLAKQTSDDDQRRQLLEPAVEGWARYAAITVPQIVRFVKGGMPGFAGERPSGALLKLAMARESLAILRDSGGDQARLAELEDQFAAAEAELEAAAGSL